MTGYTRQSAGLIIDGATIQASHHENEFAALATAFNASTGHTHTGGAGDAPKIPLATSVSGTLPVANGGTGAATLTGIVKGNGTSAFTAAVSGTDYLAPNATLNAFGAYNTNGLLTQTAANTFTGRTLTGTSNRVSVTDGDGVSGNPTVDIASNYVGQDTITTLGTVTTGTWNGTAIAVANGGTGATTDAAARTNLGAQAANATLSAVAGGTYTGASSITTLGTVTSGTWNGTAIAVANGGTGATSAADARTNLGVNSFWTSTTIAAPASGDYTLIDSVPFAYKILNVRSICTTGTATATSKINSTPLGGTANSVSSAAQVQAHSTANTMAVGDDLVVTLSSVTGAANITLFYELGLA
jgi:hypothetical protein